MKLIRNEYRDLKKENDLIFSTLAEYDRDAITEILNTVDNTRGLGYKVQLVRKDLIAMAAQAEAEGRILTDVIGDVETFKCSLLASMPKPKLANYLVDCLAWLALYGFLSTLTYTVLGHPWDCHYDAVWLVLCAAVITPSAWLLQRLVPYSWLSYSKGVWFAGTMAALLAVVFVELRLLYRYVFPHLPRVGLPNAVAAVVFGLLAAALYTWRTRQRNKLAEEKPWREILQQ